MNSFDVTNLMADPFDQFAAWYSELEKTGRENFNAVALSTSDPGGSVSSRIVLLKDFNREGFVFFTNYNSRKGKQIALNPSGAMLFYWPEFKRQVRIEGSIFKTDPSESDIYFNSRPRGHKLNALASQQSQLLEKRELLLQKKVELEETYPDTDPGRPDYWGGYRLVPVLFEFWQEGSERFHDRFEYVVNETGWSTRRLYP